MRRKKLVEQIKDFKKDKYKIILFLIFLGCLGLVLPIIPGLAILFLAFLLMFPRHGENVINKVKSYFKKSYSDKEEA